MRLSFYWISTSNSDTNYYFPVFKITLLLKNLMSEPFLWTASPILLPYFQSSKHKHMDTTLKHKIRIALKLVQLLQYLSSSDDMLLELTDIKMLGFTKLLLFLLYNFQG